MAFTWADRKRFIVIGICVLAALVLISGVVFAVLYDAPSCADGKQNQDEVGIDCGGSCAYLCRDTVEAPRVLFARALLNPNGRTDVIAYVENKNLSADAHNASYTVELFAEDGSPLGKREGRIDLPARGTVAVFVPGVFPGHRIAARAFISFDDSVQWVAAPATRTKLSVSDATLLAGEQPRITASVVNETAESVFGVTVVATVFDMQNIAIAASQTVLREVPARGSTQALFTWTGPLPAEAFRIEVLPVL